MGFRFALIMHAQGYLEPDKAPHLAALDVQVWDGREHVITVEMTADKDLRPMGLGTDAPVEQWAARMGRAIAEKLEENFLTCVQQNTLHYHENFEMVT